MIRNRLLLGLCSMLAVVAAGNFMAHDAMAAAKFEGGEASYVRADDTVDGNAYLSGNSIRVEGTVNGDVFCAGRSIIISGTVNGDVICAGSTLNIQGKVAGDVRLAGESITLSSEIGGSATVYGNTVTVESSATIARDATLGGSDVLINGAVGRDVVATATNATLNGKIGRDVEGVYDALTIADDATVGGKVSYASNTDAVVRGSVSGEVTRHEMQGYSGRKAPGLADAVAALMMSVVWILAVALALLLILPKKTRTITNLSPRQAVLATAIGFMALFALPILAIILLVSIVGLPLGAIVLFAWLILILTSMAVAAVYIGRLLAAKWPMPIIPATMLGGLLLIVACMIPLLNVLVVITAVSFGVGAVLYGIRGEHEKDMTKPKVKLAKA